MFFFSYGLHIFGGGEKKYNTAHMGKGTEGD
jgi:hypothetical protein